MKIECELCGDLIASFSADTRRKNEQQVKEAVCVECVDSEEEILEQLADLEHRQWMHWSKYVAENYDIPEKLESKWRQNWKAYSELSEEMKDKDRKWAEKALAIINRKTGDAE